jgi:hypothetical protein
LRSERGAGEDRLLLSLEGADDDALSFADELPDALL